MMLKSEERARDYRTQAAVAQAAADASVLAHVSERQSCAAAVWLDLAAREDRRAAKSREVEATVAARAAAGLLARADDHATVEDDTHNRLQIGF